MGNQQPIATQLDIDVRGRRRLVALGTLILLGFLLGPQAWTARIVRSSADTPYFNTALAEAQAWRAGRLHLDHDYYEDARVGEKTYNVTGLAFTVIAYGALTLSAWLGGTDQFSVWMLFALVGVPPPLIVTWAFFRIEPNRWWASVFVLAIVLGTPMRIVIVRSLGGSIYYINHTLAVMGLCIIAVDVLGTRRWWPAACGLILAAWSRQLTILYALPLIYLAFRNHGNRAIHQSTEGLTETDDQHDPRTWRVLLAAAILVIGITVPAGLNYVKFGNPLDSGYARLYERRTDPVAQRAQIALFSPRFIPMHLHAMNVALPVPEIRQGTLHLDTSETLGGSIWLTAPLTLFVPLTVRRWWRDRQCRVLMLGTLPVILGAMCYHTTGAEAGFYRYALDFLPIWWLVCLPHVRRDGVWGRAMAVAAVAGVLYFYWLRW